MDDVASSDVQTKSANAGVMLEKPKTLAELLQILDTLRRRRESVFGARLTLRNVRVFVAIFAVVLLLVCATSSYILTTSQQLRKRFDFPEYELEFILGSDKISTVLTAIFVGFFGNRIHKPLALCGSSLVFSLGLFLMAVPYWTLKGNQHADVDSVSTFVEAGLCFHGFLRAGDNTSIGDGFGLGLQCQYDVESDKRGAFTWFCVAQLLMGFARSFIVVLGVTFAVEAENESEIFVYIGKVAQITSQLASKGTKNQERLHLEGGPHQSFPTELLISLQIQYIFSPIFIFQFRTYDHI